MRRIALRLVYVLLVLLQAVPPEALSQDSQGARATIVPREEFFARASDFELREQWQQASDIYERALRFYPDDSDLLRSWQKAERHFSLSRRYHDASFTNDMLHLSQAKATELYREVLLKIQTHHVKQVELEQLVRLGYENLGLALTDPLFLQSNFPRKTKAEIGRLRGELAEGGRRKGEGGRREAGGWRLEAGGFGIQDALAAVDSAGRLCERYGIVRPVAVTMEFISAAGEGLDPYSTHLTPNRLGDLYSIIEGNFVGLGVEVRGGKRGLLIVNVLQNSPASEGGLRANQWIVAVDGLSIEGSSTEEAANLLRGEANSLVRLQLREKDGTSRSVSLIRREVRVKSVTHARLLSPEHHVGYIRLVAFQKETDAELQAAITKLQREGMWSLILDLRGNPGGLLDVSLQVADRFIDRGVLVSTRGRAWGQTWSHRARRTATWNFPLVLLIDSESASASEIFAGAIKDHRRGTLVGSRTFGKGSVQSIFPLRSTNTGLRLTTAYFYSPNGKVYQDIGIEPDVPVSRPLKFLGAEVPVPHQPNIEQDVQLKEALRIMSNALGK